ncbi:hypothetical protein AQJ27_35545 [Streptomyces olivochromogenes]|nr:hypothetical protein AQJ27_35545 [Streptomyces olivochromogenes]
MARASATAGRKSSVSAFTGWMVTAPSLSGFSPMYRLMSQAVCPTAWSSMTVVRRVECTRVR